MIENKEQMTESIGKILRKKREEKNITIQKICADLKVKVRDIEAIENDKLKDLRYNSYALSLIRLYAKVLQIDQNLVEEKIKDLPFEDIVKKKEHQLVNIGEDSDLTPTREMFSNFKMISFLVFIILLILYHSYENNNKKVKPRRVIERAEKIVEMPVEEVSQEEVVEPSTQPVEATPDKPLEAPAASN